MNKKFYLCVFPTRNNAMFLYSVLEAKGYDVFRLITAPCNIKPSCNYAISFNDKGYLDVIFNEVKELGIQIPHSYYAERISGRYRYSEII